MTTTPAESMVQPARTWGELKLQARRFVANVVTWWGRNLKIIDRGNRLVPLLANRQQKTLLFWVGLQLAAGVPVRIIILKARRMGMSTAITALAYYFTLIKPNLPAFAAAHRQDGTDTLWGMVKRFGEELPESERRPTDYTNRTEVIYSAPHRSSIQFKTAGGSGEVGRSKEISFLHISEEAFIANTEFTTGLFPCVPKTQPETFIFEESTANGTGGTFYDRYTSAATAAQVKTRGDLGKRIALFFTWLDFPEYRMPRPTGYELGALDDAEAVLRELGADDEQLYWRRRVIEDEFNGDADKFCQEFPATPHEAFISSGSPAIPQPIVAYHEATAKPGCRVKLVRDDRGVVVAENFDGAGPCWEVWREPIEQHQYALGADVAMGLLADPADPRSDPDYHAATVLDRTELQRVAEWHGRGDTDLFGRELRMAAEWYNDAWAAPDVTGGYGVAVLPAFRGYAHLFQRHGAPDEIEDRELARYGVNINSANRNNMIDAWISACRPEAPFGFEQKIRTYSATLAAEERSFAKKKSGKREHLVGFHDDLLWSAIIAWHLHENCPLRRPEPKEIFDMRRAIQVQGLSALARVGVRDPGIIEDDDDDY